MRIAGIVLDISDDTKGLVLRQKLSAKGTKLPEKLASARLLNEAELAALPDRLFALVATNDGDVLRKYAMHDQAHLVTSIIYFGECGHLLPLDAQQKVAMNLINGCSWYDMDPPEFVVKRAMIGGALAAISAGMGVMDLAGKARQASQQHTQTMDAFRQAQALGTKSASGREVELTLEQDNATQRGEMPESGFITDLLAQFSDHDKTYKKLDQQLTKRDQPEPELGGYPGRSAAGAAKPVEVEKKSDLNGTELMPMGALRSGSPTRAAAGNKLSLPSKTAAAKLAEKYVPVGWWHAGDLTHASPPVIKKTASHQHYALPHLKRYPIDTDHEVTKAAAYFGLYYHRFPLAERRLFAQSVYERAEELGTKIAGEVLAYAGDTYGPYIDSELHARISRFEGTGHEAVYEMLLEKKAELSPVIMASMLFDADRQTGAQDAYGKFGVGFRDPYAAVYGAPKLAAAQPKAEDTYSWNMGTDYVSGIQLTSLSKRGLKLDEMFGEGFADAFQKDPIGIFKSMPDPQKVVLSRLAADNSAGTFRI